MTSNASLDDGVDEEIKSYLNLDAPKSFFLYAGAGSGKTRSLVNAIDTLRQTERRRLILFGQRIAVITYTNAACDEIKHRLEFDPIVQVSTIHSFAWDLIGGYDKDIREWVRTNLKEEIADLHAKALRGRAGAAALERERSIASKTRRLGRLDSIKKFVYSPAGDNKSRDSLNHSEVIGITSTFLQTKPTLQSILVGRFPVLFIDESQDTNKHLMEAFLTVQAAHSATFCLGLFGDVMQRIYADGKVHLERAIPDSWGKPVKKLNHRCPQRVIRLINRISLDADAKRQEQIGRDNNVEGFVRLFIAPLEVESQTAIEDHVLNRMAEVTNTEAWRDPSTPAKSLILEHHMAARRLGFSDLYEPLAKVSRLKTGLSDGTLPALRFFAFDIYPVVAASRINDAFGVADAVRRNSPLLSPEALVDVGNDHRVQLKKVKEIVDGLMQLWKTTPSPSFQQVLQYVSETKLFQIPESLAVFVGIEQLATKAAFANAVDAAAEPEEDELSEEVVALKSFLQAPFDQIASYRDYVTGKTRFDTHQGVKGLEFPRVMVIISDEEARGFSFSYDKLFGAKAKTKSDLENEAAGTETSIDRTRRLFYVICSRAMHSLAIVAYSAEPETVKTQVLRQNWFSDDEIEMLTQ
ncbi:MAG: UvrD-helicase domain-containing protein [Burkholderiaceae bacterium]|nr:UvrD-helicase domain-containing protein [Burkholderiaceae bacterium]